jgi:hypothetical protein
MSIRRITISVPVGVARRIKKAAGKSSVSAWLTEVIEERLDDAELERLWGEFYASVAPRPAAVRKADAIFDKLTKAPRKRRVA